jgi:pimeloyl-[acyl-carrier protein] methyl ester esterase
MRKNIVIFSGWAVDCFVWKPLIDTIQKHYNVLMVDWQDVLSLEGFKEKGIKTIEQLNQEPFTLIGWSLGSLVAIELAATYPKQVDALILFSATAKFVQNPSEDYSIGWKKRVIERMKKGLDTDAQKTLDSFYQQLFSEKEQKNNAVETFFATVEKQKGQLPPIEALVLGLEYLIQADVREKLQYINVPTLLIHGEDDVICPLEGAAYLHSHLKKSQLITLKETGHIPFFTDKKNSLLSMSHFLAREGPAND